MKNETTNHSSVALSTTINDSTSIPSIPLAENITEELAMRFTDPSSNLCSQKKAINGKQNKYDDSSFQSKNYDMTNATLKVPPPGVSLKDHERFENANSKVSNNDIFVINEQVVVSQKGEQIRYHDNECSICLGNFSEGETVSWSALDCEHIFHQDCVLNWLMTLGRKSIGKNRNESNIMQVRLCRYSMKCPNCRQDFIPHVK